MAQMIVCRLPAILLIALTGYGADLAEVSQQAKAAMVAGRYQQAVALYRELVKAVPDNAGLRMNLGIALHSAGQYREAISNFEAVVKEQPDAINVWLLLGLDRLKLGQSREAIAPLEKVVRADESNKQLRLELAEAYLSSGESQQAVTQFEILTRQDPAFAKGWQGLGLAWLALSRDAASELEKLAPESPYRYVLLARSLVERDRVHAAFKLYREALAKNPGLRGIHSGIAEVYRKNNHPEWAEVEEAREKRMAPLECIQPTFTFECDFLAGHHQQVVEKTASLHRPEALYWRAQACSKLSEQCFERLGRMPASGVIHELMADAYRLQEKYDLAVQEWRSALQFAPEDRRVKKGLALALWLNREYETVRPLLEELIKTEPESAELNFQLGDVLLNLNLPGEAVHFLETAVKADPGRVEPHASLGRAYLHTGRPERAIPHLKAAVSLDRDGSLYYQLARAYEGAGESALARQAFQTYRDISSAAGERRSHVSREYQIEPP